MRVFYVLPVGSGADVEDMGMQPHSFARLRPGQGPMGLVPLREAAALAFTQDSQLRDFAPGVCAVSWPRLSLVAAWLALLTSIFQDDVLVCAQLSIKTEALRGHIGFTLVKLPAQNWILA